jgi:hypothetical protein
MSTLLSELVETAITEHSLRRTMASCGTPEEFIATSEWVLIHRVRALPPEMWSEILSAPVLRGELLSGVDMWKPRMEGIAKSDLEKYVTNTLSLLALAEILAERAEE